MAAGRLKSGPEMILWVAFSSCRAQLGRISGKLLSGGREVLLYWEVRSPQCRLHSLVYSLSDFLIHRAVPDSALCILRHTPFCITRARSWNEKLWCSLVGVIQIGIIFVWSSSTCRYVLGRPSFV